MAKDGEAVKKCALGADCDWPRVGTHVLAEQKRMNGTMSSNGRKIETLTLQVSNLGGDLRAMKARFTLIGSLAIVLFGLLQGLAWFVNMVAKSGASPGGP